MRLVGLTTRVIASAFFSNAGGSVGTGVTAMLFIPLNFAQAIGMRAFLHETLPFCFLSPVEAISSFGTYPPLAST